MVSDRGIIQRFPHSKPPFTLGDIKRAIPPHCFKRSLLRSSYYFLHDLSFISLFYYVATNYIQLLPRPFISISWLFYWLCQGCMFFGLWVLGHECGHNAFSNYSWLDDTVGLLIHSALLTPYFAWKFSHRRHHMNTSSIERDVVYVPKVLKPNQEWYTTTKYRDNVIGRLLGVFLELTLGWYIYLCVNIGGRKYEKFASHFDPYSPIFSNNERVRVMITNVCILVTIYVLFSLAGVEGVKWVICIYGIPLLVMNMLMVMTAYLNHTHSSVPHYNTSEWDWLRGALATVDRDYGFILNRVFHNIMDTHVVHHLFTAIPHYHAVEATRVIKPILGNYYHFDGTHTLKALWRESKECLYVGTDEDVTPNGVYWYSNKQ